jgi:hypothetical protein
MTTVNINETKQESLFPLEGMIFIAWIFIQKENEVLTRKFNQGMWSSLNVTFLKLVLFSRVSNRKLTFHL